jgi:hypothetical protein
MGACSEGKPIKKTSAAGKTAQTNSAKDKSAVHCRFWEFATSSALRMLGLNGVTSLRLSSQLLHLHSEMFFFDFSRP